MNIIRNPARSRPLSANVRRLMTMERESPQNPAVQKAERAFNERDLAYCDMQGSVFMAAADRGVPMKDFAPMYMLSQLAGVMDHSFSVAGGMESDDIANLLQVPLLLKSPEVIADVTLWLNDIVSKKDEEASANLAVVQACIKEKEAPAGENKEEKTEKKNTREEKNIEELAYAYWLGYIYRYECLLHDESSRMVYGAFSEAFMKKYYDAGESLDAAETCRQLDQMLVGKLWKKEEDEENE